jgi:hypothetical protein
VIQANILDTLKDQSGNANDVTCHFAASSPQFKTSALGSFTSIYWPSTGRHGNSTFSITQAQPFTWLAVLHRETGGSATVIDGQPPGLSLDSISADGGITNLNASPSSSDNTWYCVIGVFNGSSSVISLNGVETTGNAASNNLNNQFILGQAFSTDANKLRLMEFGIWPIGFTPTQRSNMVSNVRSATSGWNF